jgi:hypothetical protein
MIDLRLGMIGLSEGNGHPYSWSAIFNGYDPIRMNQCPFPVIPEYLGKQKFPNDAIRGARVTHIWCQDKNISKDIAEAAKIEFVVDEFAEMIGKVDAVLLARDDAENHLEMSKPFLSAGIPIYIDKPLAFTISDAVNILSLQRYEGQIFTCSALAFAQELQLSEVDFSGLGTLSYVDACVIKDWLKYGVHIIEPTLNLLSGEGRVKDINSFFSPGGRIVIMKMESGLRVVFSTVGKSPSPIRIRLFGNNACRELVFKDTFKAFKSSLQAFIDTINKKRPPQDRTKILEIIRVIESGWFHAK